MKIQAVNNQYFTFDGSNGLSRSVVWRLSADDLSVSPDSFATEVEEWCDIIGSGMPVPTSSGTPSFLSECLVEKVEVKSLSALCSEVTFDGKVISEGLTIGSTAFSDVYIVSPLIKTVDEYGTESASCGWYVAIDSYEDFLEEVCVDADASWAGDDFVVRSVEVKNSGLLGVEIYATAQIITTKMLENICKEEFVGYNILGDSCSNVVYVSKWRVHADDLEDILSTSGSAASWIDESNLITIITPKYISALEYELTITVELLSNPDFYSSHSFDDNINYSSREDVHAEMTDFFVSPEMCGWYRSSDGEFVAVADWDASSLSPFETEENFDLNMVNRVVKCVVLEVTNYSSGDVASNLDDLLEWGTGSRVYNGEVGGHDGSYLKIDMSSEDITDNYGNSWTKFCGVWQLAPGDMVWNDSYWGDM